MYLREQLQASLGNAYRLGDELSGGGMARVFVAADSASGRGVVLKVLPPELAKGVSLERFKREIHLAAKLHHPNIIPLLSTGQADDFIYYTMPRAEGSTLRDVIASKRQLPLQEALRFTAEIAAALSYAHRQNVVHRDIKPENILIQDGHALVADFGIARAIERSITSGSVTGSGLALGTPMYMSPEQAAADPNIDGRSDVYSLGCVVYEMLTGDPPFRSENVRTLIAKHIQEAPPSAKTARPDLPDHIDRALMTALAKAPGDRFQSSEEFAEELEHPTDAQVALGAFSRRTSPRVMAAVFGLLLAATAFGAYMVRGRSALPPDPALTVAVLNLELEPPDTANAWLGSAITRSLINALVSSRAVSTISYDGVRSIKPGAAQAAFSDTLKATILVSGTLAVSPDSLRVHLDIADSKTRHVIGVIDRQYRRSAIDTLVTALARGVLDSLRRDATALTWQRGTRSNEAWTLRQRAQDLIDHSRDLARRGEASTYQLAALQSADSLLALSSANDRSWPEPYVARGWIRHTRSSLVSRGEEEREFLSAQVFADSARVRATTAESRAGALALRGTVRLYRSILVAGTPAIVRDSAAQDLLDAVLSPTEQGTPIADQSLAVAWNSLSIVHELRGDRVKAKEAVTRALHADPFNFVVTRTLNRLIINALYASQPDSARTLCTRARTMVSDDPRVRSCELTILGWFGKGLADMERARVEREWSEHSGLDKPGFYPAGRYFQAAVLGRSGKREAARALMDSTRAQLVQNTRPDDNLVNEAQVLTILGERDRAIASLQRALAVHPGNRDYIANLPWFAALRTDPRFKAMIGQE
jgi:serine/threonine protein kinase/tetratricopeptide (TPR) repeat protein